MHFLFGAGGTGGHLYPALSVAASLKKINPEFRITFTGRQDKIEGEKVKLFGYDFLPIDIVSFSLRPSVSSALSAVKLFKARNKIIKFIKAEECSAVIAAGAYISIPPGFAAVSSKKPLFLMESNVNPGKAISLLTARAAAVFTSFEESSKYFPKNFSKKIFFTGNPVRNDFEDLISKDEAKKAIGIAAEKPMLLIFGGSLGALSINNFVIENLSLFGNAQYNIIWQTGKNFDIPNNLPENIAAFPYIDDMPLFYAASDLIVSRSGASTISELTITAKPSVLIPLPGAANNEQFINAQIMSQNNASVLVTDSLIHSNLINIVNNLINDKEKLAEMSENAKKLSKYGAGDTIASQILKIIKYNGKIST